MHIDKTGVAKLLVLVRGVGVSERGRGLEELRGDWGLDHNDDYNPHLTLAERVLREEEVMRLGVTGCMGLAYLEDLSTYFTNMYFGQ